jgi:hypothetical protein
MNGEVSELDDKELWFKAQEYAESLCELLRPENRGKAKGEMPYWLLLGMLVGSLTTMTRELSVRANKQ